MTKSSVCSLYADLTKLLGDINKFLEEQINNGNFKSETLNQALRLIDRSKFQIERIDAIAPRNSTQNDDYVVMHSNVSVAEPENDSDDDHYALVVETIKKCDVGELPACEIIKVTHIKSGLLTYHRRRERWFFRREQHIKVYAAVFEEHLLVYKNEKSEKPWFCLNLLMYRGEALFNSKKYAAFVVTDKNQTYNFTAQNKKDMEQWLNHINSNELNCQRECLPEKPTATITKPKMPMQKRPIPDIPPPTTTSYHRNNANTTYATPGEDQGVYYAVESQNMNDGGEYDAYSSVVDENEKRSDDGDGDDEDDEKIYAMVVPPPTSPPVSVHTSFLHRQTARR